MNKYLSKLAVALVLFFAGLNANAQAVVPTYSGDQCVGATVSFFSNAPGGTYLWEFGDASATTSTQQNPIFSYTVDGTYTVKLTVTRNGVATSGSFSITIKPTPIITIALDPLQTITQCFVGNTYCYTFNSTNTTSACKLRVLWGDGTIENFSNVTFPKTVCHKYVTNSTVTTKYAITAEATSCDNCIGTTIEANGPNVLADMKLSAWSNQPRGCDSVLAKFVNKSLVKQADVKRFIWYFDDGTVDSTKWGASPDTLYHWYKVTGPKNGTFTVKLFVETFSGCTDTFFYNAAATNFVFRPRIIANKDSACVPDATFIFTLRDSPPDQSVRGVFWHFVDLPVAAPPCSGCEDNNVDYPQATFTYGAPGPYQVSLYITHQICPPIIVFDTIQVIGAQSKVEDIPNQIMIAQNHRYQCVVKDTVQFTNVSKFYHNDSFYWDDDSTYDIKLGVEIGHKFKPDQTAYDVNRTKDNVFRIWDFDDDYAPRCTTDTKAGKNVGINCKWSMDTLPKHWYSDWDSVLAYDRVRPLSTGIFDATNKACNRKNVWYSDSNAIIVYTDPFKGKDSIKIGTDSFGRGNTYTYIGGKDTIRDTIPLPFYKPGFHTLIEKIPARAIAVPGYFNYRAKDTVYIKADTIIKNALCDNDFNLNGYLPKDTTFIMADTMVREADTTWVPPIYVGGDSVDAVLYRKLFYNTVVRCFQVKLTHLDTMHVFRCEHEDQVSLAIRPPSAKGLQWRGIRCLAPPSPPYGIVFNVSQTKPGCSQDILEFNFDSAGGRNNWVQMVGGLFPGSAPPPPPIPVMPYAIAGPFPTSFVYLYGAGNLTDKKNGWVTVGLVVGNGVTTPTPCYDTIWYNRMLKFRFANPAFTIERPIPRAQIDKAACRYDSIYFRVSEVLQPDVETFDWNWDDADRIYETKKSYDTAQGMKQFFIANIANIEKYIYDKEDLSGRLSPYAAYIDSIKHGWTAPRTFSPLDEFHFHTKLPYHRDSIKKWLQDPKALIGWNIVTRNLDLDKEYEVKKGLPRTVDITYIDTFLTSIVTNYKTNTIIAPEITPLIIDIFNQLGFDYFDIPADRIADFFGPPGSGSCIDTTGYSSFISFEYEEVDACGKKIMSQRDTSVIKNWYHRYAVAEIVAPRLLTRTRIDGCVQFASKAIKIGFGKEIIFSDTVLCINNPLWGLANYWYHSTLLPWEITDATDYWRIGSRINKQPNGEPITKWDWNYNDADTFKIGGGEFGGAGLGFNPPWFTRPRLGGASGLTIINKNLQSGMDVGVANQSTLYYKNPGVFPLAILATDSNGCTDTTFQDIYVTKLIPKFFFDLDTPQCKTIVEIVDSSYVIDGCFVAGYGRCDSIVDWEIDWGDGTPKGGKNNFNREATLGHNYTRKGTFTVTMIVKTAKGCTDSFKRVIVIPGPKPFFEPEKLRVCQYDSIKFFNTSIDPTTSSQWIMDFGDGGVQSTNGLLLPLPLDTFVHVFSKPGKYQVYMTQYDSIPNTGKYCPAIYPDTSGGQQMLIEITVIARDSTDISATDSVLCKNQEFVFFNKTRNPGDTAWESYKWIPDIDNPNSDTLSSSDSFRSYAYKNSGFYRATVVPQYRGIVQLPHCPYRDTMNIYVDTLKAMFNVDTTNTPDMKFINTSFNSVAYRWWFLYKDSATARGLTDGQTAMSTAKDPLYTYDSLGCYWVVLEATSPDGCKDTTAQLVCNQFRFIIKTYNIFTPGAADGLNDKFDIPIEGEDLYELVIYNRYGTKVFESEDADNDWNGRLFNTGANAAAGTYYYYLKYKDKRNSSEPKELFGVVILVR